VTQLVQDQGLGEVVVGPLLQRLHGRGDRRVAGHHDDFDRLVLLADLSQEVQAAHVRHPDVAEEGVEEPILEQVERFGGRGGARHLVPPLGEGLLEEQEDGLLVVYD
jgi:hypothetical protein